MTCSCAARKGKLTINKVAQGGDDSFSVSATPSGGSAINYTLSTGNSYTETKDLSAGIYEISETPPAGWELVGISCGTGPSGVTASATVASGQTTTCTVTNRKTPTLKLIKSTVDGDGTTSFSFTNTALGNPTLTPPGTPEAGPVFVTAGAEQSITETVPDGWSLTSASCVLATSGNVTSTSITNGVSVTPQAGQDVVCTFTNTKQQPGTGTVKITKKTDVGDATFSFTSGPAPINLTTLTTSGTTVTQTFSNVPIGDYSVAENDPTALGYTFTSLSCTEKDGTTNTTTAGSTATIKLEEGETVECTFNNTKAADVRGSITIKKQTLNGFDAFPITATGPTPITGFTETTTSDGETSAGTLRDNLTAGVYEFTETLPDATWVLTGFSCTGQGISGAPSGPNTGTVTLDAGGSGTCTFVNTKQDEEKGSITIEKRTELGTGTFSFTTTKPDAQPAFSVGPLNTAIINPASQTISNLEPGAYSVSEIVPAGWNLTSATCVGNGMRDGATSTVNINLEAGQNIKCTFVNTKEQVEKGSITIEKRTELGTGTFSFTTTKPAAQPAFSVGPLNTAVTNPASQTISDLEPGAYSVTEIVPAGWHLTSATCVGNGMRDGATSTVNINLEAGQNVKCTFVNTKEQVEKGSITIEKRTDLGTGSFNFTTTKPDAQQTFGIGPLNTAVTNPASQTLSNLEPGAYSVTEIVPAGWKLTSATCVGDGARDGTTSTVKINLAAGKNVKCTFVNTKIVGQLTLTKTPNVEVYQTLGQSINYSYVATNSGNQTLTNVSVTDDKIPTVVCPKTTLAPAESMTCTGAYVITTQDLTTCSVTNVATVTGTFGDQTATATANATIKCDPDKTRHVIRNFINKRVDLLASNDPDRARLQRRFDRPQQPAGSLKDDGPMKLGGSAENGNARFSFATSLSQMAQANASAANSKLATARQDGRMGLGASGRDETYVSPSFAQVPGVDVWVEGHFQKWEDDLGNGDRSGSFGILYVGADYLINPWILVGALVQFDWMDDKSTALSTDVSGTGWMAGPYVSMKLSDAIVFDARAAWGQSDNDVSPFGTYKDSFETDRWLAKANLTGNWFVNGLRISPSVGVIYVEETQNAYVDSLGATIAGQSVHIGRMTFGPEFGYAIQMNDGSIVEPHISFTGMWDFDKDETANIGGLIASTDEFRVKTEAGLMVRATDGTSARATISYDGLGSSDLDAWGGQLWLSIPLN